MTSPYLAIAQQGKNGWKRYLSGLLVLAGFLLLATIQIIIIGMLIWGTKKNLDGSPHFTAVFSLMRHSSSSAQTSYANA